MIGHYRLLDDSVYEVFLTTPLRGKPELMAKCVNSDIKSNKPFPVDVKQIQKNINFKLWVKLDSYETDV